MEGLRRRMLLLGARAAVRTLRRPSEHGRVARVTVTVRRFPTIPFHHQTRYINFMPEKIGKSNNILTQMAATEGGRDSPETSSKVFGYRVVDIWYILNFLAIRPAHQE